MKSIVNIWKVLAIICAIAVITTGAWWHLPTCAICYFMSKANEEGVEESNDVSPVE